MGDVVNMAARIMGLAAQLEGGGVACDLPTREFLLGSPSAHAGSVALLPERLMMVKGKADPISITDLAFTSEASGASQGGDASPPPEEDLVGRANELRVMAGLAAAFVGGTCQDSLVIVEARQGMGKVPTASPFFRTLL